MMSSANDDWKKLTAAEKELVSLLDEKVEQIAKMVQALAESSGVSLELGAVLEDTGNFFLGMSEEVSASCSRRSRLRAVE